jgi:hypothetical protein
LSPSDIQSQAEALEQKKRQADEALKNNQRLLDDQRRSEEELRRQIDIGPDEAEIRARHMREQRDKLLSLKKQEREAKVAAEEARIKENGDENGEIISSIKEFAAASQVMAVSESKEDAEVERKRTTMRIALARRMKQDLIVNDEDKASKRVDQFSELDKKLKEVETLRIENQRREYAMQEQIRKQQAKIARNMKLSASMLPDDDIS